MNHTLLLYTAFLFLPLFGTETRTPFTQEDVKKISFNCDAILEHMDLVKAKIQEIEKEIAADPQSTTGLRLLSLKINELDFLANYLAYHEKCLKK